LILARAGDRVTQEAHQLCVADHGAHLAGSRHAHAQRTRQPLRDELDVAAQRQLLHGDGFNMRQQPFRGEVGEQRVLDGLRVDTKPLRGARDGLRAIRGCGSFPE
jgi:hypothetical protein